ncbi:MAG: phage holin family protein [Nocardioidaceae bacterium]
MSQGERKAESKIDGAVEQPAEPTIGRLVADASRDISALVQSEIALAKSELRVSVKAGGIGAALLAVGGFFGVLIIIFLSIAVAYFITMTGLHAAWAFLIVAGFYLLVTLILVLVGIKKLKKVRAPERTISTAKEIPSALKGKTPPAISAGTTDR